MDQHSCLRAFGVFFFFKVNLDKNHRATLLFDDEQMLHVGDFVEEERALCIVA